MNIAKHTNRFDAVVPTDGTGSTADKVANDLRRCAARVELGGSDELALFLASMKPTRFIPLLSGAMRLSGDKHVAKQKIMSKAVQLIEQEANDRDFNAKLENARRKLDPPIEAELVTTPEALYRAY